MQHELHGPWKSHLPTGAFALSRGGGGGRTPPSRIRPLVRVGGAGAARRRAAGRQRGGGRKVVAQAERGGDEVEAVQPSHLASPPRPRLLLQQLVQVGSQAAAHPAAEPPGAGRPRPRLRRGGALARLRLLAAVVEITCRRSRIEAGIKTLGPTCDHRTPDP